MRLTVWIDGRDAVPVRAIPYITSWNISPDMLVSAFSGESEFKPAISAIQTFRKNDGIVSKIQSSGWKQIKAQIDGLDQRLSHDLAGRAAWEAESVELLPYGIFVWLDDFVSAFSEDFSPASRLPDDRGEFPSLDFAPLLPNGVEEVVFHEFDRSAYHGATISYISAEAAMERLRSRIRGISIRELEIFVDSGLLRAIDSDNGILFDEREISEFVPRKRFFAFEDLVERWEDRACGRQGAVSLVFEQVDRKRLSLYGGKDTDRPTIEAALFSFGEIVLTESNMRVEVDDARCGVLASERELYIDHWVELTDVGIGKHESYLVANDRISFRQFEVDFISAAPAKTWQAEMLNKNRAAPELTFPCSPSELLWFVDKAIGIHCFSVPDAFRTEVERLSKLAIQSEDESAGADQPTKPKKREGHRPTVKETIKPYVVELRAKFPKLTAKLLHSEAEKNAGGESSPFAKHNRGESLKLKECHRPCSLATFGQVLSQIR